MPIIPNLVRFPVSIPPMRRHQHRFLHLQRRTPCRILRQPLVSHHIPYRILRQPLVSCHIPLTFQGILTPVAMEMECHPAEVPEVAQEEDPVEVLVVALVHHFGHHSSLVEVVDPLVALVDMDHSVQEEAEDPLLLEEEEEEDHPHLVEPLILTLHPGTPRRSA